MLSRESFHAHHLMHVRIFESVRLKQTRPRFHFHFHCQGERKFVAVLFGRGSGDSLLLSKCILFASQAQAPGSNLGKGRAFALFIQFPCLLWTRHDNRHCFRHSLSALQKTYTKYFANITSSIKAFCQETSSCRTFRRWRQSRINGEVFINSNRGLDCKLFFVSSRLYIIRTWTC